MPSNSPYSSASNPTGALPVAPRSRTPAAHASNHASDGSDPVTITREQISDLTSAGFISGLDTAASVSNYTDFVMVGGASRDSLVKLALTYILNPRSTISVTPPTANDDLTHGNSVGSTWFNALTREAYICVDYSIGAAVWKKTTSAADALDKLTYDPNTVGGDVFDMDNMVEGATNLILTAAERSSIASISSLASLAGAESLTNKTLNNTNSIVGEAITSGTVAAARLGTMTGDSGAGGASGAAPAPASGDAAAGKFLKADGSWALPPGSSSGDMLAATYDPGNVASDAFDMDNMIEGATNLILTAAERMAIGYIGDASALSTGTVPNAQLNTLTGDFGSGGVAGIVPAPAAGDAAAKKFLKADATWVDPLANQAEVLIIAVSDETTNLATGTAKVTFRMPFAMTLTAVRASVTTAPTGSTIIVDINKSGATILSTRLSIDASEKTSTTAASAAVISNTALTDDAEITIDIDQVGSTVPGAGLKVVLIGTRA